MSKATELAAEWRRLKGGGTRDGEWSVEFRYFAANADVPGIIETQEAEIAMAQPYEAEITQLRCENERLKSERDKLELRGSELYETCDLAFRHIDPYLRETRDKIATVLRRDDEQQTEEAGCAKSC